MDTHSFPFLPIHGLPGVLATRGSVDGVANCSLCDDVVLLRVTRKPVKRKHIDLLMFFRGVFAGFLGLGLMTDVFHRS